MARQIQIRRALPEDAPAIAVVLYESFVDYKALYTEEGFAATTPCKEQIEVRMREGPVCLASCDGTIVGTVSAVARPKVRYIRGMAAFALARGTGAGDVIPNHDQSKAAAEGPTKVFTTTTTCVACPVC